MGKLAALAKLAGTQPEKHVPDTRSALARAVAGPKPPAVVDEPKMPDPAWNAYWRIDPRPDGSPAPDGPVVSAIEDKNELIAAGQAVAVIPAGVAVGSPRPDLTTIPLDGVEPSHVVLATRAGDRGRLVAAFRKGAQALLTGS